MVSALPNRITSPPWRQLIHWIIDPIGFQDRYSLEYSDTLTYSSDEASESLFRVLREDVGLQFSTVRSVNAFAETVACAVMNLVEEVADARNCYRF